MQEYRSSSSGSPISDVHGENDSVEDVRESLDCLRDVNNDNKRLESPARTLKVNAVRRCIVRIYFDRLFLSFFLLFLPFWCASSRRTIDRKVVRDNGNTLFRRIENLRGLLNYGSSIRTARLITGTTFVLRRNG